jgi:hypothetical protein
MHKFAFCRGCWSAGRPGGRLPRRPLQAHGCSCAWARHAPSAAVRCLPRPPLCCGILHGSRDGRMRGMREEGAGAMPARVHECRFDPGPRELHERRLDRMLSQLLCVARRVMSLHVRRAGAGIYAHRARASGLLPACRVRVGTSGRFCGRDQRVPGRGLEPLGGAGTPGQGEASESHGRGLRATWARLAAEGLQA